MMNLTVCPPGRQRGAAALLFSVVLLIVITLVVIYTAGPIRTEQQVTANEYRAHQALNAAEAGLYYFLGVVRQQIAGGGDPLPLALLETSLVEVDGVSVPACTYALTVDGVTRTFRLGSADTPLRLLGENLQEIETRNCVEWGGSRIPVNVFFIEVAARGFSDDGIGQRLVRQMVEVRRWTDLLPPGGVLRGDISPPTSPLVALGDITLNGNFDMFHPDGFTYSDGSYKAVAGGDITPPPGQNRNITEDQVSEFDGSLYDGDQRFTGDEFFWTFLGSDKETIQSLAYQVPAGRIDATTVQSAIAAGYNIIWVDGSDGTTTTITASGNPNDPANWMGTPGAPITLIVDGVLRTQGNQQVHGMVYATGDIQIGAGTIDIYGTVLTENDFSGVGTMNIHYDANRFGPGPDQVEEGVLAVGEQAEEGGLVAGSWRDF